MGEQTEENTVIDLSNNKRVTVRKFKGINLVDIREHYLDNGVLKPGKKGISLTEDLWHELLEHVGEIDDALAELGGKRRKVDLKEAEKAKIEQEDSQPAHVKQEDKPKAVKEETTERKIPKSSE